MDMQQPRHPGFLLVPTNGYLSHRRFSMPAAKSPTSLFFDQLQQSTQLSIVPEHSSAQEPLAMPNLGRRMSLPVQPLSPTKMFNMKFGELMASYNNIMFAPAEQNAIPEYSFPPTNLSHPSLPSVPEMTRASSNSPDHEYQSNTIAASTTGALAPTYSIDGYNTDPVSTMPFEQQPISYSPTSYPSTLPSPQSAGSTDNLSPQARLQSFIDPKCIKKNNRFKVKDNDLACLMSVFEKNPFPSTALRTSLAKKLGLEPKQVQFWFQNRRATLKMNGIHVVKPKASKKDGLVPVSQQHSFFYVEEQRSGLPVLNEDEASIVQSLQSTF